MTGRTLKEIRQALRLHPSTFAQNLGYTESRLKKLIGRQLDEPITDRELMIRAAQVVPHLIVQRIQELQTEVQGLQRFGPPLDELRQRLAAQFKQERWKDRFDNPEGEEAVNEAPSPME